MSEVTLPISSLLGHGFCVSAADGQKIYAELRDHIIQGDRVTLSFSGITRMTTAFLNAAVGQAYGEFDEETVRRLLAPPTDTEPWQRVRLKMVVDRAKQFFKDEGKAERTALGIFGLSDE